MKNDLFDLSAETKGVALIITGLTNQLESSSTLTASSLTDALFGVSCHLLRISDELAEMSEEVEVSTYE